MNSMLSEVVCKLNDRSAVIGIVGLGYVGLPLAVRFSGAGYRVVGLDIDPSKPEYIRQGRSYIKHISDSVIRDAVNKGFSATSDMQQARTLDAIILCVPTPLDGYRNPDLRYVIDTIDSLLPCLHEGQIISLESTTYPGTTEEELAPRIESKGFTIGQNFFLVYSPEREDPGNPDFTTQTIPKVCSGSTGSCLKAGLALYGQVIDRLVPVRSTRVAEMAKLLENIHRAVNIGLVNEMKMVADAMDIDIHEVIEAAATKPFGFVSYQPGPGLGGHCIPIDPFYLTWKARQYGINTRFIELAGEVNRAMPDWVVSKITLGLNRHEKPVNGSRILILGIAYKKNVDDMRESPAVEIMSILKKLGANVAYSDPYVPAFPQMRRYYFDLSSIELTPENLGCYDCVVLTTDHDEFNYPDIERYSQLVVDARGRYQIASDKIIKA